MDCRCSVLRKKTHFKCGNDDNTVRMVAMNPADGGKFYRIRKHSKLERFAGVVKKA